MKDKGMVCGVCQGGYCGKCRGGMKFVAGLIVLAWALWYPTTDWRLVLGGLLALSGLSKLVMNGCGHCYCK